MITILKPDYLLHVSEGAEEISEALHNEIIKRIINRIMLRISRNDDYVLTAYDKWNIETLQQAGYLLEDIQKEIAKATKLQEKEIAEAMEDAGVETLSYDDKIYKSVGLSPTPLTQSPELIRLMQRNYEATLGEWHNFTRTTAEISQQLFINQLDKFYMLVSTGAMGYTQALKEIIDTVVSDGVRVYYDTGHSDTIETATLRAVRTGISQMSGQIQITRMDEMNLDLVITSSHLGARPTHQEWQGKIFSRSGRGNYPNFEESTGYGTVSGLCGANCRHSFSPYFEGMDNPFEQYDSEENRKQYEKEQRQRTLERRIRKTKREVMGWKEAVDAETDDKAKFELDLQYQKKSSLLQKQNEAYREYCEKNNLRPLADRITIARWNRQQAAAARGAAKRYENANGGSVAKSYRNEKEQVISSLQKVQNTKNMQELEIQIADITKAKIDFSGADFELMKENMEQLVLLGEEYGYKFKEITTTGARKYLGEVTRTGRYGDIVTMMYPKTYYKSKSALLSALRESANKGEMPSIPGKNISIYTTTHEFAHTLSEELVSRLYGVDTDFWDEIEDIYVSYKKSGETVLGKYAKTNQNEFMAEAFANAKLAINPSEYSIKVLDIIDKYFKKKKK